jgi:hypothetical protein
MAFEVLNEDATHVYGRVQAASGAAAGGWWQAAGQGGTRAWCFGPGFAELARPVRACGVDAASIQPGGGDITLRNGKAASPNTPQIYGVIYINIPGLTPASNQLAIKVHK